MDYFMNFYELATDIFYITGFVILVSFIVCLIYKVINRKGVIS